MRTLFALNPLVGVLEGFRWCLVEGQPLHISYAVYSVVAGVTLFLVGGLSFRRMERKFADVV